MVKYTCGISHLSVCDCMAVLYRILTGRYLQTYIAVAWQFYTDLSRLPCRDPPPRNRRRVLYRNLKIQAIQGCFSDFSSPPYPHARSRYTIPRSDQRKRVPFCACGRRRKARYESVHTPCKTFGLFGQPSEILDRVSCIFFVYLFHTE